MTTPSEHSIVGALRQATDRIPLPPEARWIREPKSNPRLSTIAVVGAAAIFIVAVGGAIGTFRVEPRVVPAAGRSVPTFDATAFAEREDAQWRILRGTVPADRVLLRPAWIPEFRGSVDCPSSVLATVPQTGTHYTVRYTGLLPNGTCASMTIGAEFGEWDHATWPRDVESTFDARGTTVHVERFPRTSSEPQPLPLSWNESGWHNDWVSNGVELKDLMRVIRSLEPMP